MIHFYFKLQRFYINIENELGSYFLARPNGNSEDVKCVELDTMSIRQWSFLVVISVNAGTGKGTSGISCL